MHMCNWYSPILEPEATSGDVIRLEEKVLLDVFDEYTDKVYSVTDQGLHFKKEQSSGW